jgi:hypothetical protein
LSLFGAGVCRQPLVPQEVTPGRLDPPNRLLLVRWEFHTQNFLGFVQLACLVILFRQF